MAKLTWSWSFYSSFELVRQCFYTHRYNLPEYFYHYLIEYPSQFSKESLKAYKSIESYNFFISGHVKNVYYHEVEKKCKFCFIKTEVWNWSLLSFWIVYMQHLMLKILDYLNISNMKFRKNSSLILTINDLRRIFSCSMLGVNILVNSCSFFPEQHQVCVVHYKLGI